MSPCDPSKIIGTVLLIISFSFFSAKTASAQVFEEQPAQKKCLIYSNLLYDLSGWTPNIGTQLDLGRGLAVNGRLDFASLGRDKEIFYWRMFATELTVRKYFDRPDGDGLFRYYKGHHVGVYGQIYCYDLEMGFKGYVSHGPGEKRMKTPNLGVGIEYGYTRPLTDKLFMDFSFGLGYAWGKYRRYVPDGEDFVWSELRGQNVFGPTRFEVSLYYLFGL